MHLGKENVANLPADVINFHSFLFLFNMSCFSLICAFHFCLEMVAIDFLIIHKGVVSMKLC